MAGWAWAEAGRNSVLPDYLAYDDSVQYDAVYATTILV